MKSLALLMTGLAALGVLAAAVMVHPHPESGRRAPGAALPAPRLAHPSGPTPEISPPLRERDVGAVRPTASVAAEPRPLEVAPVTGHFGPEVPREGRTASLTGRVFNETNRDARFTLTVTAGPNIGMVVDCDEDGRFLAEDLYPGYGMVVVSGTSGERCERELILGHRQLETLSLSFADRGVVHGAVRDETDAPVAGATVSLDGHETHTDAYGEYRVRCWASGEPLLIVRGPGFVPYLERLPAAADPAPAGAGPTNVILRRGGRLELSVPAWPGDPRDAVVYLLPAGAQRLSGRMPRPAYPWHLLNPLRLEPGQPQLVEGLPDTKLQIHVFHPSASSRPTSAWVLRDRDARVELELDPLPVLQGEVLRDGEPVAGAQVELRWANPMSATQGVLGPGATFYRSQPIEIAPQVVQETETDASGRFWLGMDRAAGSECFVSVTSPDGSVRITRSVRSTAGSLAFDLARAASL